MRRDGVLIALACLLVYCNSLENSFHYDDEHSVQKNIHIRDLKNIPRFFKDPAAFSVDRDKGMYRPLLLVTYALNYATGGDRVWGFHLVNLALHAANACLVAWLAGLLSNRRELGLIAGLLFAVHPLGTEPVNYISSRSESLAGLFYLLGLALFISGTQRGKSLHLKLSWAALAGGLLSKSTAITLPAVLLLYDYLLVSNRRLETLRETFGRRHLPYWLLAGAYLGVITWNKFLTASLARPVRGGRTQFLTQVEAFAYYLKLLFWPVELNVEHQFFEQKILSTAPTLLALALLSSFGLLLAYLYRRRWALPLFLNGWALLALLPVVVMPLNVLVNERRLYLPCAALCIGLALIFARARWRRGATGGLVLLLLGYAALTFARNRAWADDFSLWQSALARAPLMPRAHLYLGNAHKDAAMGLGQQAGAGEHWKAAQRAYQRVIELNPQNDLALRALNNLGAVSFVLNDIDAAEKAYRRVVELNPQYADALVNLGTVYHERARQASDPQDTQPLLEQSIGYYERALEILPNHADAWANLGLAHFDQGDFEKAGRAYERAHFLNPNDHRLLNNMGNLNAALGQRAQGQERRSLLLKAVQYYQQALRLNPAYDSPRRGLGIVGQLLGQ